MRLSELLALGETTVEDDERSSLMQWVDALPKEHRAKGAKLAAHVGMDVIEVLLQGFPHYLLKGLGAAIEEKVADLEQRHPSSPVESEEAA